MPEWMASLKRLLVSPAAHHNVKLFVVSLSPSLSISLVGMCVCASLDVCTLVCVYVWSIEMTVLATQQVKLMVNYHKNLRRMESTERVIQDMFRPFADDFFDAFFHGTHGLAIILSTQGRHQYM